MKFLCEICGKLFTSWQKFKTHKFNFNQFPKTFCKDFKSAAVSLGYPINITVPSDFSEEINFLLQDCPSSSALLSKTSNILCKDWTYCLAETKIKVKNHSLIW